MPFPTVPSRSVQTFHPVTRIISSAPLVEYLLPVSLLSKFVEARLGVPDGILRSLLVRSLDSLPVPKMLLLVDSFRSEEHTSELQSPC